jgi:hypothetical protein
MAIGSAHFCYKLLPAQGAKKPGFCRVFFVKLELYPAKEQMLGQVG